jgi:hypothetical protein
MSETQNITTYDTVAVEPVVPDRDFEKEVVKLEDLNSEHLKHIARLRAEIRELKARVTAKNQLLELHQDAFNDLFHLAQLWENDEGIADHMDRIALKILTASYT